MLQRSNYMMPEVAEKLLQDVQTSYQENNTFIPEMLESLISLYGDKVLRAMHILDNYQFTKYTIKDGIRSVYKLSSSSCQHLLFGSINFCTCETFTSEVLAQPPLSITCEHVLSLRFAIITGAIKCEVISNAQMTELLNNQISLVYSL